MDLIENTSHLWLIAGVLLILFEFFLMPGIGFLFAGLGALLVGALVELGLLHQQAIVWIVFFATTIIFAIVLWKPLAKFRPAQSDKNFSDMIGHKAILINSLAPGENGQIRWSGTIMNARLDANTIYSLSAGTEVIIKEVVGNTVVVAAE